MNYLYSTLLAFTLLLLYGCPVSTTYPLENSSKGITDVSIYGNWYNDSMDAEVQELTITSYDANSMKIQVLKKGSMYMADADSFKAWFTTLDKNRYLILQELDSIGTKATYYLYQISSTDKLLITHDISLRHAGIDAVVSVKSYQKEVKASSTKPDFISNEIVWQKRP